MGKREIVSLVSPRDVLEQIAGAVPESLHRNIIIIGSLAAGYYFFGDNAKFKVRTKDVDCLLSPQVEAISAGRTVVDRLFEENWRFRSEGDWGKPGDAATPDNQLPVVRLYPPGSKEWFLEFLTVPRSTGGPGRIDNRLVTSHGHFNLCSFHYLSLAQYKPLRTPFGISIARPEIMALANLLGHPEIGSETMSGLIGGRRIKRSNKDLGRALAIAHLSLARDEEALLKWPDVWKEALQKYFLDDWKEMTGRIGKGLEQLLQSPNDLEEALYTCRNGLLASRPPTLDQIQIDGQRLMNEAVQTLFDLEPEAEFDFGMVF